ncbi:MAG TPA: T9SS type A sorting domain-containing protein, partial [Tenuifilaceae bacterium]|nr:T9SS type A sorting domain-containing protein [Tenuifilaceae bacterium]
ILLSSSNYTTPNFEFGYGLPNFASAINSIDKLFDENKLSIFPNPNNGRFSVWLPQNKISTYSILVTSSHGAEVMRETFETNSNIYTFSIPSTETSGLYIVNLMVGSKNYLGKIIKIDSLP